jgi:hypothetical protein
MYTLSTTHVREILSKWLFFWKVEICQPQSEYFKIWTIIFKYPNSSNNFVQVIFCFEKGWIFKNFHKLILFVTFSLAVPHRSKLVLNMSHRYDTLCASSLANNSNTQKRHCFCAQYPARTTGDHVWTVNSIVLLMKIALILLNYKLPSMVLATLAKPTPTLLLVW